jgi:uncharacterized membrane protein
MNLRTPVIASVALILAMAAVSAWGWNTLPAGARMATHWDLHGHANGFLSRDAGLLLLPAIAIALTALFVALPVLEPARVNLVGSRKPFLAGWIGGVAVLAVAHLVMVMRAAGVAVDVLAVILVTVAVLITVIGNYLSKSQPNLFIGFRLPWSLLSDLAWEKSHRVIGRGFFATGLLTIPVWLLLGVLPGFMFFAMALSLSAVAGTVTSYLYWRRDPDRRSYDRQAE